MAAAAPIAVSNAVTYQGPTPAGSSLASSGLSFGEVLSDLNPLQYLPVVGTLYRAITGDTIPRPLREAGSLVVSGLIGGPIGAATNLAMLGFQKLSGIDLEQVEQDVIAALTPAQPAAPNATLVQSAAVEGAGPPLAATSMQASAMTAQSASAVVGGPVDAVPWTAAQLAAYGVVTDPEGELHRGDLIGADVLNGLQLGAGAA